MTVTRDEVILQKALRFNRFFVAKYLLDAKVNPNEILPHAAMHSKAFPIYYRYHRKPLPGTVTSNLNTALYRCSSPEAFPFLCSEYKLEASIADFLPAAIENDQHAAIQFIASYPERAVKSYITGNANTRSIVFSMQHHFTRALNYELTRGTCERLEKLILLGACIEDPTYAEDITDCKLKANQGPTSVTEFITPTSKLPNSRYAKCYPQQSAQLLIAYGAKFNSTVLQSVRRSFDAKDNWLDDNIKTYHALADDDIKVALERLQENPLDTSPNTKLDEAKISDKLSLFRGLVIRNNLHRNAHTRHLENCLAVLTLCIQFPKELLLVIAEYFPTPRVCITKHLLANPDLKEAKKETSNLNGLSATLGHVLIEYQHEHTDKVSTKFGKVFQGANYSLPREIVIAQEITDILLKINKKDIAAIRLILAILTDNSLKVLHGKLLKAFTRGAKVAIFYQSLHNTTAPSTLEQKQDFLIADLQDQMAYYLTELRFPKEKLNLTVDALIEELKSQPQLAPDQQLQKLNPKFQTF